MRRRWFGFALCALVALAVFEAQARRGEPERVTVQHILIGFKKTVKGKELDRSKAQAKALAYELLDRAEAGEDFAALVEEYTDDRVPGIYVIANDQSGVPQGAFKRRDLAVSFGDVAFRLDVGEVGLAKYHAANSPFGFHVIKRLE